MNDTPTTHHERHDHAGQHPDHHAARSNGQAAHDAGHAHGEAAHDAGHAHAGDGPAARVSGGSKHGRDKIDWGPDVWKRIDAAVKHEITRARVCAKFLPTVHVPAKQTTVLADIVNSQPLGTDTSSTPAFNIDESASLRINEFWVEFALTPAQVEEVAEGHHSHGAGAAITLATRAANVLAQVEDSIILQGASALNSALFSATSPVNYRNKGVPLDLGLLGIGAYNPASLVPQQTQIIQVPPVTANGPYQSDTVAAVAQAFSMLQAKGQYGPYALVLQTTPFADVNSPLPTTLITPAEPIRHLMDAGLYGAGTMPPFTPATAGGSNGLPTTPAGVRFTGVCVSIGGEVVDLVRGHMQDNEDVVVRFEQKDVDGNYRFRVVERFALRIKDVTGIVQLLFM